MVVENILETEDGEISLQALKGYPTNKIIKVEGLVEKRKLMVLINSGSTPNFLDEKTAKELHYKLKTTFSLLVKVVNGNKIYSKSRHVDFCWKIQGHEFFIHLQVFKLGVVILCWGLIG